MNFKKTKNVILGFLVGADTINPFLKSRVNKISRLYIRIHLRTFQIFKTRISVAPKVQPFSCFNTGQFIQFAL